MVTTVSQRIRELRNERGLSQKALAKQIGVSQKAIDYWERHVNEPKASYVVALADFFQVSADFLLGRNEW
ncbi:MAG: helix-turn-helix transcriptional regulator [Roseburia sp.]|nr:helix-turn-helix transcriptional regulator [Roseburia sp.]